MLEEQVDLAFCRRCDAIKINDNWYEDNFLKQIIQEEGYKVRKMYCPNHNPIGMIVEAMIQTYHLFKRKESNDA